MMADLDLHCLPMFHKKDARLKWVNIYIFSVVALDETLISSCLHFSMQIIEMSCDLEGSGRSNVNISP